MTKTWYAAALTAALALSGAVNAQSVNQRQGRQQARIDQGVASGRLTAREAVRDERQQGRIDATEARMRANNGGRLNGNQRERLETRQNRASAHIYNSKHNGRRY
jgi:outer membrane lipoprotein SlyB